MIRNSITVLLFVSPIFTSATSPSLSAVRTQWLKKSDTQIQHFGSQNSGRNSSSQQGDDNLRQNVDLLTRGQCHIRRATAKEDAYFSAIVAVDGSIKGETGQFVYNDEVGVSANNSRFVLTALHALKDKDGKFPTIDPFSNKIDPSILKIHVQGCSTDQKVIAICTANGNLKDQKNDYAYLVLDKSKCNIKPKAITLKPALRSAVDTCPKIHVACSLTPGLECGTAQNRNELTEYNAISTNIAGRRLFFGDGKVEVTYEDSSFVYDADAANTCSGGAVICSNQNSSTLIGVHRGGYSKSANFGLQIHQGMIDTLQNCSEQMKENKI